MATAVATSTWHYDRSRARHALPLALPFTGAAGTTHTRPGKVLTSLTDLAMQADSCSVVLTGHARLLAVRGEHTEHAHRYASRVQRASTTHGTRGPSTGNMRARPGSDRSNHLCAGCCESRLKAAAVLERSIGQKDDQPSATAGGMACGVVGFDSARHAILRHSASLRRACDRFLAFSHAPTIWS